MMFQMILPPPPTGGMMVAARVSETSVDFYQTSRRHILKGNSHNHGCQNLKSHFFIKSCRLWNNVEKYCRVRQATDDNMAHFTVDTYGYKHTLRICHIYCFSIATMVARMLSILRYTYIACLDKFIPCLRLAVSLPSLRIHDIFRLRELRMS